MLSVPLRDQQERNTFSVGLIIAFASWALIFITLVWGYLVFRMRASVWLAEYVTPQINVLACINTAVIIVSSWALTKAFKPATFKPVLWVWSAFVLGVFFLFGQVQLWRLIMGLGLHWQSSQVGSFFFLLTGFHALHIIGGLAAIVALGLSFSRWQGSMTALGIKYFWDFLYIVWVCLFILLFIIR